MYSGSYMGTVQWQAATASVPALKAIAPMITSMDFYRAPWFSPGGALALECTLGWSLGMAIAECSRQLLAGAGDLSDLMALVGWMGDDEWVRATPLADKPLVFKYMPWLAEVFEHPGRDDFWLDVAIERVIS